MGRIVYIKIRSEIKQKLDRLGQLTKVTIEDRLRGACHDMKMDSDQAQEWVKKSINDCKFASVEKPESHYIQLNRMPVYEQQFIEALAESLGMSKGRTIGMILEANEKRINQHLVFHEATRDETRPERIAA